MRVLVLRALGLGDLLTAVPALRAVRRAYPKALIQLAGPGWLAPLAWDSGAVDVVLPAEGLSSLPTGADGADLAVNLHGRGPQSTALLETSGPGRLLAWGRNGSEWLPDEHEVPRWCRLLAEAGLVADPTDFRLRPPGPRGSHLLVHPGAGKPSRRWPLERWAGVVAGLPPGEVLITAGPAERAAAERVALVAGRGRVLCPDLVQLCSAVASAALVIAPDTGIGHLATAYRTPSLLLFGPTSPALWGPPDDPRHQVLWAGETGENDAPSTDPGLLSLTPSDVLAALPLPV